MQAQWPSEINNGSWAPFQLTSSMFCMPHNNLQATPQAPRRKLPTTTFVFASNGQGDSSFSTGRQYQPHPCHDCSHY